MTMKQTYVTTFDIPNHFPVGQISPLLETCRESGSAEMVYKNDCPQGINITWEITDHDDFNEFDISDVISDINATYDIHIERPTLQAAE